MGLNASFWRSHSGLFGPLILVVLAFVLIIPRLSGPMIWTPDGLYYRAQMYEIQGDSQSVAIQRSFAGTPYLTPHAPKGFTGNLNSIEWLQHPQRWIRQAAAFYRRRWLVPLMAAAIYPLAGRRALLDISLFGDLLIGPLLFWLLRRRYSAGLSLIAAGGAILLPPVHMWAGLPLTDSWGIAIEILTMIVGLTAIERGGLWYAGLAASVLAMSFTHDGTVVWLVALALAAAVLRQRRVIRVLVTSIMASLPAPLIFGGTVRLELSNVTSNFTTLNAGWSYIATHYPHAVWVLLSDDVRFPGSISFSLFWYAAGIPVILSLLYLGATSKWSDSFFVLAKTMLVGSAVSLLLVPNYTQLRLELVVLPSLAVAFAHALSRLRSARLVASAAGSGPREQRIGPMSA